MATLEEIKQGMGLDQILARETPAEVYGALRSPVMEQVSNILDVHAAGNINGLVDELLKANSQQSVIADALSAAISQASSNINNVIDADLAAQADIRKTQDMVDLTTQILPSEVQTPDLLDIVTTDVFKEIINIPEQIAVD